jgi:hypothetical protein
MFVSSYASLAFHLLYILYILYGGYVLVYTCAELTILSTEHHENHEENYAENKDT